MRKQHYHVLVGIRRGCMPEDNRVYPTLREAREAAAYLASLAREDGASVRGSAKSGFYCVDNGYIEINPCDMEECLNEI